MFPKECNIVGLCLYYVGLGKDINMCNFSFALFHINDTENIQAALSIESDHDYFPTWLLCENKSHDSIFSLYNVLALLILGRHLGQEPRTFWNTSDHHY